MTIMIAETAGTPTAYIPTGTLALVPDLTPVKVKAPRPVQHCEAPQCDTVIGARGLTPRARKGRRFCSDDCRRAGRRAERFTETADYGLMAARVVRSYGRRVAVKFDELGPLAEIVRAADEALRAGVAGARAEGLSWTVIGEQLGITRQAAQQRFGK